MNYLNRHSLGATLDSVGEALFSGKRISEERGGGLARWLATRQGLPGSYGNTFAPTKNDLLGIYLFTGEPIRSRVGIAHVLGEESCRVLFLLAVEDEQVKQALSRAVDGLSAIIEQYVPRLYSPGFYCCGTCSAAYWRNLAIGLLPKSEERLRLGLAELAKLRAGDGKWRRFPFFYTSLVLTEIGPRAKAEIQYASVRWERILKRLVGAEDVISKRRTAVGRRLLELCNS